MSLLPLEKGAFFACDGGAHAVVRVNADDRPTDYAAALWATGLGSFASDGRALNGEQVTAMLTHIQSALLMAATQPAWIEAAADDGDKPLLPSFLRLLTRWRLVLLLLQSAQSAAAAGDGDDAAAAPPLSAALIETLAAVVRAEAAPVQLLPAEGHTVEDILRICPILSGVVQPRSAASFTVPRCTLAFVRAAVREGGVAISLAQEPAATAAPPDLYGQFVAQAPHSVVRRLAAALLTAINAGVQTLLTGVALEEMSGTGAGHGLPRVQVTEALLRDTLLCLVRCGV
jgi:hypothetical protein